MVRPITAPRYYGKIGDGKIFGSTLEQRRARAHCAKTGEDAIDPMCEELTITTALCPLCRAQHAAAVPLGCRAARAEHATAADTAFIFNTTPFPCIGGLPWCSDGSGFCHGSKRVLVRSIDVDHTS